MPSRRSFLGGVLAAAGCPSLGWAAAGAPAYLSAARNGQGLYVLIGLCADASIAFSIPLPDRGHAAAAHPTRAEAVAFARRPGTYALVIGCAQGVVLHRMRAPAGRHFYGHGAFSADGETLFTTENEIATGAGRIGIWDVTQGYRRSGEVASGGIGPHEIVRLPGRDRFAIANGGIRTHPRTGRQKLNLDAMRPNLTVINGAGQVIDKASLPNRLHQNSLRHIAAFADGRVACAFQWQGDPFAAPSLAGIYTPGAGLAAVPMQDDVLYGLDGYAGSVAVMDGYTMALTYPRGGAIQIFDTAMGTDTVLRQMDICGVAGAMVTDGLGRVSRIDHTTLEPLAQHPLAFDNHLVLIGQEE
ncbi:DUF1513 domain-containing protein [Roseobacter fucihabitans]